MHELFRSRIKHRTNIGFFLLFIAIAPGGISAEDKTKWVAPLPLGSELEAYRAPSDFTSAQPTITQEPGGEITLRQALAAALLYNPDLAVFSLEVRAAEARRIQAGLLANPDLDWTVENFSGGGDLERIPAETTLSVNQLIELGGKRGKRARVAAFERDVAAWDYERTRLDVFTRVSSSFIDVLTAQQRVFLSDALVQLAEHVSSTVSEKVKAGKVSPVEETKTRVDLSTARIVRDRATRELEAARIRLATTWAGRYPAFDKAQGNLEDLSALPAIEKALQLTGNSPDVARWRTEVEHQKSIVSLEKSRRLPDLSAGGGVRRFGDSNGNAFVAGISIPLPFFNRNQGAIRESQFNLAKAESSVRSAEVQARNDLAENYQLLSASYEAATALKNEILPSATSAYDAVREGYQYGKFGILDVLDAQRTLFSVQQQYIDSLDGYHKARTQIERLIARPLVHLLENNDD